MNFKNAIQKLGRDEKGLSTVEYVVLLAVILVLSVGLMRTFGDGVATEITEAQNAFDQATD